MADRFFWLVGTSQAEGFTLAAALPEPTWATGAPVAGFNVWNTSAGAWQTWAAGVNSQPNIPNPPVQHWGPAAGMAKRYLDAGDTVWLLQTTGLGPIHRETAVGVIDWHPASVSEFFAFAAVVLAACVPGLPGGVIVEGLVFVDGEHDAFQVHRPPFYKDNHVALRQAMQNELGTVGLLTDAQAGQVPSVISLMPVLPNQNQQAVQTVRVQQVQAANDDDRTVLSDSAGLTLFDNIHFDAASCWQKGLDIGELLQAGVFTNVQQANLLLGAAVPLSASLPDILTGVFNQDLGATPAVHRRTGQQDKTITVMVRTEPPQSPGETGRGRQQRMLVQVPVHAEIGVTDLRTGDVLELPLGQGRAPVETKVSTIRQSNAAFFLCEVQA